MNLEQLLSSLTERHVQLWAEGPHLRVRARDGVVDATLRSALVEHKPRLLELLHQARGAPESTRLEPLPRNGPPPLSLTQERLWRAEVQEPGLAPAHIATFAMRLDGPLDRDALTWAVATLVERHEVLRTAFALQEDTPVQVIAPPGLTVLKPVDLRTLDAEAQQEAVRRLLHDEQRRRIDLAQGPLFRAWLLLLSEQSHVMVMMMHHTVVDGASRGALVHELTVLYAAFLGGEPCPLAPLRLQYADYARWQRRWLVDEVLPRQLGYWKQQLADPPPRLEWPSGSSGPAQRRYLGGSVDFRVEQDLVERLRAVGQQAGCTLFMVLLSSLYVLLARACGQRDLLIGTPAANRGHTDLEPLVGTFLNTLALRLRPEGSPSFRELLTHARAVALGAYAHPDVPPEAIGGPTPDVMLVFKSIAPQPGLFALKATPLALAHDTALLDLTLYLEETPMGLRGEFIHDSDRIDAATVTGWARELHTLLRAFAEDPRQAIFPSPHPQRSP
ncbi:condensation domain-containing protein [Myxococcus qinghaiensis]|uniref:condensation domain-containing protein n=1 Tax=Myxococcus qinghaiensis TaxID=2906758 RepID=UPI0020A79B3B|nr:condensation domain-containing protein [Myxococcus qinghaiensis]MCP3165537.1 condensation domain-containing protein [Myxococcus qinghaiensis]